MSPGTKKKNLKRITDKALRMLTAVFTETAFEGNEFLTGSLLGKRKLRSCGDKLEVATMELFANRY